jgi:glycosidase
VLYQIMVDRFRGDGGVALSAPSTASSRAGGTLDGVRAEIDQGLLEQLGVSAIWISPVYANPTEMRVGRDGHLSEGYHGYWPLDSRAVDPRIGGETALHALVATAHAHGIRVLLDLVPNHVYEANPRYVQHSGDGWFRDGADKCVCGDPGCDWTTHIQTCWFTPFLPDCRFQNADVMRQTVEDTLWWTDQFEVDGVRIDAVPMMERAVTRRMARALRDGWSTSGAQFVLGEVFTGPGEQGVDTIRSFMGPDGLDSAFDFPLMWSIRAAIATHTAGFDDVEAALRQTDIALSGSGAVMARIIGNHDTTRFISEANGDATGDPWTDPAVQPTDHVAYARQTMALALIMTLPGLPVVYYGDETGLAGGSDPDSRRVMPSVQDLTSDRLKLLQTTRRLGQLRACSRALSEGVRVPIAVQHDRYAFVRDAGDGLPVIVVLSGASSGTEMDLSANAVARDLYVDLVSGESVPIGVQSAPATVPMLPLSVRVLVPSRSPCVQALAGG